MGLSLVLTTNGLLKEGWVYPDFTEKIAEVKA